MESYPGNARNQRAARSAPERQEKVERVTQSDVIRRKKPLSKRFVEFFVGGDPRSVGTNVMLDVLLPAMRDMIANSFTTYVESLIYGDIRGPGINRRQSVFNRSVVPPAPYHRMSNAGYRPDPRETGMSRRGRATHDFGELILATRHEAQEVLNKMFDLCQRYEQVTVSDLYDLVGETPAYTDDKYGWTDLRDADIRRVAGGGYLLVLPPTDVLA